MPPRRTTPATQPTTRVSQGAGMVAGLELWRTTDGRFALKDTTTDGRFADDVALWSGGLNPSSTKKTKNAAH